MRRMLAEVVSLKILQNDRAKVPLATKSYRFHAAILSPGRPERSGTKQHHVEFVVATQSPNMYTLVKGMCKMNDVQILTNSVISKETQIAVASSQVSTDVDGDIAILNLDSGVYYGLSNVGACIWNLIGEPKAVAQIHQNVLSQYDVTPETLYSDLIEFFNQLADAGLIAFSNENSA